MFRTTAAPVAWLVALAVNAGAQSIPGAVLAKREPHHRAVYEDSTIRVLRVRVPGHDTTLLHEHDPDYFWVSLGVSTLVNAKPGSPDATVTSPDLAFHYAVGHFAHVARNPGNRPFDNITVELLQTQSDVRNLCEEVVAGKPRDCPVAERKSELFSGVTEHPAFSTSRDVVSLVSIPTGRTLRPAATGTDVWVIALDTLDTRGALTIDGRPRWIGGTMRATQGERWAVKNHAPSTIRVIVIAAR